MPSRLEGRPRGAARARDRVRVLAVPAGMPAPRDEARRPPPDPKCRRRTSHTTYTSWRVPGSRGGRPPSVVANDPNPPSHGRRETPLPILRERPRCRRPSPAMDPRAGRHRRTRTDPSTRRAANREPSEVGHASVGAPSAHVRCDSHSRPASVRPHGHSSRRSLRRSRPRGRRSKERNSG